MLLGVSVVLSACGSPTSPAVAPQPSAPSVALLPAPSVTPPATPADAETSGSPLAEPTQPTDPADPATEAPPAPPSADAPQAEAAFKALDKEIAAKYDTPDRHTYTTLSGTLGVVEVDPLTRQVVFGADGRLKMKVTGKFALNAAEAEKWDLRLDALIKKYESPEWIAATIERQGNLYDTLRTGLANATPALFDGVEAQQLATMRASGHPQLIAQAAQIEASKREFWEKKRKQELDAADVVVVKRYATMVACARAKGLRNERVTRALRRLAFYTDLIGDDTMATIVTSTPNPNDRGATKLTYRKRQYVPSPP
ncbi:hypothetical protein BH11MYX4_BH11MYX4_20300 [soil metagenome]